MGPGHEAGPVGGDDVGHVVGDAGGLGGLLIQAGGGGVEPEDPYHAGADDPPVVVGNAAHVVGGGPGLALGGAGQGQTGGLVGQAVVDLDGVTHGVDGGVGGLVVVVDLDAAGDPQLQPGVLGQAVLGSHADGQDHGLGGDLSAGGQDDAVGGNLGQGVPHHQFHAVVQQLLVEHLDHVVVQGGHDLVGGLHQGDLLAQLAQVLRGLQADEAAADDRHPLHVLIDHVVLQGGDVHHVADGEDVGQVGALDGGGDDGPGAGREDQDVVALGVDAAVLDLLHLDGLGGAVDGEDLLAGAHVDVILFFELLRAHEDQLRALLDVAAQVVGQGAVGEGDVRSPLEDGDVRRLVQPTQTGSHRGPAGHTAHNQNTLHNDSPYDYVFREYMRGILLTRK